VNIQLTYSKFCLKKGRNFPQKYRKSQKLLSYTFWPYSLLLKEAMQFSFPSLSKGENCNTLKHIPLSSTRFGFQELNILQTHCIYLLMDLKINSNYLPAQQELIGFMPRQSVNCTVWVAMVYTGILFSGFNKFSWGQRTERMGIWGR